MGIPRRPGVPRTYHASAWRAKADLAGNAGRASFPAGMSGVGEGMEGGMIWVAIILLLLAIAGAAVGVALMMRPRRLK